jgi:hypothetical protein
MKFLRTFYIFALSFQFANTQTCPSDETATDLLGPYYLPGAPVTKRLAPASELCFTVEYVSTETRLII